MTIEEKEKYLLKSNYSAKDVMALTGVQKSRASVIMNECRTIYNGSIKYRPSVITSKSFWLREGTTIEEQYRLLGIAKGYIPIKNEQCEKAV